MAAGGEKTLDFAKMTLLEGVKRTQAHLPFRLSPTPAVVDDYRQRSHREVATLLTIYWRCAGNS
jgi:hypothetical protein